MNKLKLIIGIILLFSLSSFGQKIKDLNFDIKDFQQKLKRLNGFICMI